MAWLVITLRVMPEDPDVDLDSLQKKVEAIISEVGKVNTITKQPIGFGIVALDINFSMDEKKGDTEPLQEKVAALEGVNSAEITAISRALG
jgi:elongation factor 1-beta